MSDHILKQDRFHWLFLPEKQKVHQYDLKETLDIARENGQTRK